MQGLASVVVLYHPDLPEVLMHLQSFASVIDHFFLVDNSEADHSTAVKEFERTLNTRISYIPNHTNRGIACALNQGCVEAIREGYSWCLLMDQDSFFKEQDLHTYIAFFTRQIQNDPKVGILSLLHGDLAPDHPREYASHTHSITSGSIISLPVFQLSGGHDEFLFIDEVDADYSYRLEQMGYQTIRYNLATLQHRLGVMREARLMGLIRFGQRSFHAPWRNYYMMRNYLIVRHRHIRHLPHIYKKRDRDLLVSLKNNIFFSGHFWAVSFHVLKGLIDGFRYRHKLPASHISSQL